jgi:hypothetical protein
MRKRTWATAKETERRLVCPLAHHREGANYKQAPVGIANDVNDKPADGTLTFKQAKKAALAAVTQALAGKKPLMVILDEDLIKAAKIAAIEDGRNVSGIVQELLVAWLAARKARK